jgi:hypothetical protein
VTSTRTSRSPTVRPKGPRAFVSTVKLRQAGFTKAVDTEDSFRPPHADATPWLDGFTPDAPPVRATIGFGLGGHDGGRVCARWCAYCVHAVRRLVEPLTSASGQLRRATGMLHHRLGLSCLITLISVILASARPPPREACHDVRITMFGSSGHHTSYRHAVYLCSVTSHSLPGQSGLRLEDTTLLPPTCGFSMAAASRPQLGASTPTGVDG